MEWLNWRKAVPICLVLSSCPAYAYTLTLAENGAQVRWPEANVRLPIVGNPVNVSGLDADDFYAAVVRSLGRWKAASGGRVDFDYWQGTDPQEYEANSNLNGHSSVYFASNTPGEGGGGALASNVLGLTQVWYDTKTGAIIESDTVLNDRDFVFTTDPRDTSGFGSSTEGVRSGKPRVYVENVLTHELGHSLGLSHSGELQSTMLYLESPEQAHLGCDELSAIRAIYGGEGSGARGAIRGSVVTETGEPLFGAQVQAISRRRGTVLASALTDRGGNYLISALEPGSYYLLVEPYYAGPRTLPVFFADLRHDICPGGEYFSRGLLESSDGLTLDVIPVSAGGTAEAPRMTARCAVGGGAAIAERRADFAGEPLIYNGEHGGAGFGAADRFSPGSRNTYRLHALPAGKLELHVLSYSLYSPVRAQVSLVDASGAAVPAQILDPIYEGDSGYVNHDSAVIAEGLAGGDYELRVTSASLNASEYPAGPIALDSTPFFVITGSINEGDPVLKDSVPFNARCRMNEVFAAYQSPAGPPPRRSTDDPAPATGCGTISSSGGAGGGGTPPAAILGWFLPFLAAAALARLGIRVYPLARPTRGR